MNYVITTISNYDFATVYPFLESFRAHAADGTRLVIFYSNLAKQVEWSIRGHNPRAILVPLTPYGMHCNNDRFFAYQSRLHAPSDADRILLCDSRDVMFQRDPFDWDMPNAICSFLEDKLIGDCEINRGWIRTSFGDALFERLRPFQIACAGTIAGPVSHIRKYLNALCSLLQNVNAINPEALQHPGSNQSAHNVLTHLQQPVPFQTYTTQNGPVVNLGFTALDRMRFNGAGQYINDNGLVGTLHLFHKVPCLMARRASYTAELQTNRATLSPPSTDGPAPFLDLRSPGVTLICASDIHLNESIRAVRHCLSQASFAKVLFFTSKPVDFPEAQVINIDPLISKEAYSRFCIHQLPQFIDTDYVLICQYDGFIVNTRAWSDDFLNYDYLGAPCWWSSAGGKPVIGNGGFSLRSRKLLRCLHDNADLFDCEAHYHPEDKCISFYKAPFLTTQGIKFAPFDVGANFAWMRWRDEKACDYTGSFGIHVGARKLEYEDFLNNVPQAGKLTPEAYPASRRPLSRAARLREQRYSTVRRIT